MPELIPPAIYLILAALLIGPARGHLRTAIVLAAPLITLWFVWQVPNGVAYDIGFLDYRIEPLEGSAVRRLFATIFALMAFCGGLYAFRQARWYELAAAYAYAAGAIGVSFAGDLVSLFVYWEFMALFSTVVVWCGGTTGARRAGIRYAIMHLLGGVILMVGIEGVAVDTGSIDIRPMLEHSVGTWMMLAGILINAAAPPVSAWLADAYPTSSATGSVFLSAFTTKTAILTLILLYPGEPVLIGVGLFMVMYGIIYALLEN
ncbi:MAG: proton-conducting transporter transmembrane domain-containing protein, partial [Gammaproteobacteria bacterium]